MDIALLVEFLNSISPFPNLDVDDRVMMICFCLRAVISRFTSRSPGLSSVILESGIDRGLSFPSK